LFEAVVDAVMREVHAKLAAEAAGLPDPLQALERGVRVFLKVCTEPNVQRILLVDAPAVLGWPKWREMDARYGFGLVKQALAGAMKAGLLRRQDVEVLAHVLLGALTEAAMVIARSRDPSKIAQGRRAGLRVHHSRVEAPGLMQQEAGRTPRPTVVEPPDIARARGQLRAPKPLVGPGGTANLSKKPCPHGVLRRSHAARRRS